MNEDIFLKPLPKHIGIIMDGNGRWAKKRNLPRMMGHNEGAKVAENIVETCANWKIKALSLYAFSTENWKRTEKEIANIFGLLDRYIEKRAHRLFEGNVRFMVSGDYSFFPEKRRGALKNLEEKCSGNTGLTLNLCLNYGARDEIVKAVREIVAESPEKIDYNTISNHLYTKDLPDIDLLIRPSGELRLSNFMLLQSAYAELWFSNILWPDFTEEDLKIAISDFQNRDRRFGGADE